MDQPFTERRKNAVSHEHIQEYQASIRRHFDTKFAEVKTHFDGKFDEQNQLLKSAFPNGDLDGHRRAHETIMANAADREKLWKTVLEKTISGSVWAAIVLLAMALWEMVKDRVKK